MVFLIELNLVINSIALFLHIESLMETNDGSKMKVWSLVRLSLPDTYVSIFN